MGKTRLLAESSFIPTPSKLIGPDRDPTSFGASMICSGLMEMVVWDPSSRFSL